MLVISPRGHALPNGKVMAGNSHALPQCLPQDAPPQDVLLGQSLVPCQWDNGRFRHIALIQEAARNQGRVELAEDTLTGRLVAMKVMPLSWICESHEDFVAAHAAENELPWRDIAVSRYLSKVARLPHVCEYVGLFRKQEENGTELCLVLSYCAGGDLFSLLERSLSQTGTDRESFTLSLMRRVLRAVADVHALGIAHGDLSLENVLLVDSEDPANPEGIQIRLIDFGASTSATAIGVRGKPSYQAPEVHSECEYDAMLADAFSVGVMIFTLVVGNYPWKSTRKWVCPFFRFVAERGLAAYLQRRKLKRPDGEIVTVADTLSPHLVALLTGLLSVNPETRLGVLEAVNHPWFAQADGLDAVDGNAAGNPHPGTPLAARLDPTAAQPSPDEDARRAPVPNGVNGGRRDSDPSAH